MTRRPKFSNIGSRSEIGTGSPSLTIFRWTRSGGSCRAGDADLSRRALPRSGAGTEAVCSAQCLEIGKIIERVARVDVFLVRHREGATVAGRERQSGGFALGLDQHFAQPVRPGEGRFRDAFARCRPDPHLCARCSGSVRTTTCTRAWLEPEI